MMKTKTTLMKAKPQDTYKIFAPYYDALGFNLFSFMVNPYLEEIFVRLHVQGDRVLDLACGTGSTALWLNQLGMDVTGVDISPDMLTQARKKAREEGALIRFQKKDMRHLNYKQEFDLTLCLFDSINHILHYDEIGQIFQGVEKSLVPGGYFMFDSVTPYELSSQWNDTVRKETSGNIQMVLTSKYDKSCRTAHLTGKFSIPDGKKTLHKIQQFHERAYTRREIKRALAESGLELMHEYKCFSFDPPTSKSFRIFYVARKMG